MRNYERRSGSLIFHDQGNSEKRYVPLISHQRVQEGNVEGSTCLVDIVPHVNLTQGF
jgi:hypothetical protein